MSWKTLLTIISGGIELKLLQQIEYLKAENRVLRKHLGKRPRLDDSERRTLAVLAKELGRKALAEITSIVTPDTLLRWHRKLVARKYDMSHIRKGPGRPSVSKTITEQVLRFSYENPNWGCRRIQGALRNLALSVSHETIAKIMRMHGIEPYPERRGKMTWKQFIHAHMKTLWACDFFTTEVWTAHGLVTQYVLIFVQLSTRRIYLGGIAQYPDDEWMKQIARNVTFAEEGFLEHARLLIHDRDGKFCGSGFRGVLRDVGIRSLLLPPRSPNLNAHAERVMRSIQEECVDRMILFGERHLRHVVSEYIEHYNTERNHQGVGNELLLSSVERSEIKERTGRRIYKKERLGGMLNYYFRTVMCLSG